MAVDTHADWDDPILKKVAISGWQTLVPANDAVHSVGRTNCALVAVEEHLESAAADDVDNAVVVKHAGSAKEALDVGLHSLGPPAETAWMRRSCRLRF